MASRFKIVIVLLALLATACNQESHESLLAEGAKLLKEGNAKGAVVIYKTCLERFPNDPTPRFELARAYLQIGKPDQAENELRKLQDTGALPPEIHLAMGKIKLAQRRPAQARTEFQAQLDQTPQNAEAWEGIGLSYIQEKSFDQACQAFERALVLDPGLTVARSELAAILMDQGNLANAQHQIEELLSRHPDHHAGMHLLAQLQTAQGDVAQAAVTYETIKNKHPKDVLARSQEALIRLLTMDQTQPAQAAAKYLITNFPKRPEGYRLAGLVELRGNELNQAITNFQQALKQGPDVASNLLLAQAYLASGKPEMAVSELCLVLDQRPDDAKARLMLANLHMRLNRVDEAIAELERLMRLQPDNAQGKRLLGDAMALHGDLDKSLALYNAVESTWGPSQDIHLRKGVILAENGRTAEAETALRQAVAQEPSTMEPRLVLATFLKMQGRFDEAVSVLDLGQAPPDLTALAMNAKARIRLEEGRMAETEALLQKAREAAPNLTSTYHNLAQVDIRSGRLDRAMDWYRQILERSPQDTAARLALAQGLESFGQTDEALIELRQAADSKQIQAYLQLINFLSRHGQPDQALLVLETCLKESPNLRPALILKARLLASTGDEAGAQATLRQLEQQDKDTAFAERFRAELLAKRWDKAESLASRHLEEAPRDARHYLPLAKLREAQGDLAGAQQVMRRGMEADKANQQIQVSLALLLHKSGDNTQALQLLAKAIQTAPNSDAAFTARGIVNQNMGDFKGAKADYEKALVLKSQSPVVLNNLAMLYADNPETAPRSLELAWVAYVQGQDNPSILDTLGYAMIRNNQSGNAVTILNQAARLAPKDQNIAQHLSMAKSMLP